jgi:hypothetical protein
VSARVLEVVGRGAIGSAELEHLAIESMDGAPLGPAESPGVLDDGLQHRLQPERRAGHCLQDVAERRLLLQRRGQVSIARLELLEESRVLDGDHGLVGKGLKQRDLLVRERIHLGTPELDRAHGRSLPQQWNTQRRPVAQLSCEGTAFGKLLRLGRQISNVNSPALEHRASSNGSSRNRE